MEIRGGDFTCAVEILRSWVVGGEGEGKRRKIGIEDLLKEEQGDDERRRYSQRSSC